MNSEVEKSSFKLIGFCCVFDSKIKDLVVDKQCLKIFSASSNIIKIWDFNSKKLNGILRAHTSEINAICLSINEDNLISACSVSFLIWDISRKEKIRQLEGHSSYVSAIKTTPNYIFSGSNDKTIRVWDFSKDWEQSQELQSQELPKKHQGKVTHLSIDSLFKIMVSGSGDKHIVVWNIKTLKLIITIKEDYIPNQIAITPDSKKILSIGGECIRIWDIGNLDISKPDPLKSDQPQNAINFNKQNWDKLKKVTKLNKPEKPKKSDKPENSFKFRNQEITKKRDKPEIPKKSDHLFPHYSFSGTLAINAKSEKMFTFSINNENINKEEKSIFCMNLTSFERENFDQPRNYNSKDRIEKSNLNFTPDSKFILWVEKSRIKIWNIIKNILEDDLFEKKEHDIDYLVCSKDCRKIAAGNEKDCTIFIWDFIERIKLYEIKECDYANPMIFVHDSSQIVFNTKNNEICVWDLDSNKKLLVSFKIPKESRVRCIDFTYGGKTILLGCKDGFSTIDYDSKKIKRIYEKSTWGITVIDKTFIITMSDSQIVKWNIITQTKEKTIQLNDIIFAQTCKDFIGYKTKSENYTRLIDFDNNFIGYLKDWENSELTDIFISPDGKFIASKSEDEYIYIWTFNKDEGFLVKSAHKANFVQKNSSLKISLIYALEKQIISIDSKLVLKIWDFKTKLLIESLNLQNRSLALKIENIKITKDSKIISFFSNKILTVDLKTRIKIVIPLSDIKLISSLSIFHDDPNKIIITENNSVIVWDLDIGKSEFIRKFIIPCKLIQKSSLSPDSENLVVIDKSLDLWILNMNNEKENKISENCDLFKFTPDSKKLIMLLKEKLNTSFFIFHIKDKTIASFSIPVDNILQFIVTLDDKILYSTTEKNLKSIDFKEPKEIKTTLIREFDFSITALTAGYEENTLVFADETLSLFEYDLTLKNVKEFVDAIENYPIESLYMSPDSKKIIGDSIWDCGTKKQIIKLPSYNKKLLISPDPEKTKIIIQKSDYEIIVWDSMN